MDSSYSISMNQNSSQDTTSTNGLYFRYSRSLARVVPQYHSMEEGMKGDKEEGCRLQ